MDTKLTDIELIQRISNRDSKALEALYDRFSPVLYTLVKKIVTNKAAAEEVITEIFIIIWQKSSKFDVNSANLYSWIINLSRNKAMDFIRRERALIVEEYNDEYEDKFIFPNLSAFVPPNDLEKTFNRRDKIYNAFYNLTEAQQYVLSLAYYEGLSESNIASKLNIPLLTVKSKIRVALNSVKEYLEKEENQ